MQEIRMTGTPKDSKGAHGGSKLTRRAIAQAKAGDSEGLHYLYVRYADDVLRFVASFVRDHHEAEDITQNVFAKLMTAIKKYEQREVPFDAWILRVARTRHWTTYAPSGRSRPRRSASSIPAAPRRVSTAAGPCAKRWKSCPRTSARCSSYVTSSVSRRSRSLAPWTRLRARSTAFTI